MAEIYGEETLNVDIFNGMTLNTGLATDNFCSLVNNVIKSDSNELIIRDDLILIQDPAKTSYRTIPLTDPIPRNSIKRDFEVFTAVGSQTVNSPSLIAAYDNATTIDVTWLNCNSTTPSSVVQTISRGVKAFCQYRDRYYGSNGTSHIFRISNFTTTPATPLTLADLTTVGVNFLIAFKNRIFGFTRNRIYWTDLAAIGGYPETWNLSLNFSDLPSVDYDITIHNVKVYRDKLYMFTDKGVYYLQANGDPLNWITQLVSANFPVYDRDAVALNKNIIFLTDQTNVHTFDGSKFETLPNLRSIFYALVTSPDYSIVNIYPYEDGILLARTQFVASGGNYASVLSAVWYYDLNIWTMLSVTGTVPGSIDTDSEIISAGVALTPYRGKNASSYMYYRRTNASQRCLFSDTSVWLGDCLDTNHAAGIRSSKYFRLVSPVPTLLSRFFLKVKYVLIYGKVNMADAISLSVNSKALAVADMTLLFRVYKFPSANGFGGSGSAINPKSDPIISITGNITAERNSPGLLPALVICGCQAVVNSDNRDVTEQRT